MLNFLTWKAYQLREVLLTSPLRIFFFFKGLYSMSALYNFGLFLYLLFFIIKERKRKKERKDTYLKAALRVLFFLTKAILTKPSHSFERNRDRNCITKSSDQVSCISTNSSFYSYDSNLTWKLTGGGGFFGSILTTLDSTFGGGRKLFFPTCFRWRRRKTWL